MTRLLLVSGSPRAASMNTALLHDMAQRLHGRCSVDLLLPPQVDLPLFNQDLEGDPLVVQRVAAVHRRVLACDGIVVASPEYNGQLTPYLKNLVDWVSRLPRIDDAFDNAFAERPVLLCSATAGRSGGTVAVAHARALFGYVGGLVLGHTVCLPHADHWWSGDGFLFDDDVDAQVDTALASLLRWAQQRAVQSTPAACATS